MVIHDDDPKHEKARRLARESWVERNLPEVIPCGGCGGVVDHPEEWLRCDCAIKNSDREARLEVRAMGNVKGRGLGGRPHWTDR